MRSPSAASRSRTRGWRMATGPMPVMISRSGRCPWRTTRCWPVSVLRSACFARNSATSASTAWVSNARAPPRRISVKESLKAPGWASLMTLLSDTAYHSFIGEVEALNTTTIRRLTPSCRHQLLAIAPKQPGNGSLGTVEKPPFYGIELHPAGGSSAGLLTDVHARVIHQRRRPIPGLYASGNAAAVTEQGIGYQAGLSLAAAMRFSYLAVRHMLHVRPVIRAIISDAGTRLTRASGSRSWRSH